MTTQEESPKPDISELMEKIRSRVRAEVSESRNNPKPFNPKKLDLEDLGSVRAGELVSSEDLAFLNRNHILPSLIKTDQFVTHRKGVLGKLVVRVKTKLATIIKDSLLSDYVSHQQQFFIHLVRYLNSGARYTDARDADIFWQLIHKIDTDVGKALERIERIRDEATGASQRIEKGTNSAIESSVRQINSSLGEVLGKQQQQASALSTLDSVVRGLEGLMAMYSCPGKSGSSSEHGQESQTCSSVPDLSYVLLENRFRGSESEIKERQLFYAAYFSSCDKPVLDVGCGRGELLEVLREKGVPARGIDLDQAMINECLAKTLDVENRDLISYLQGIEDHSLGGLIALQVVEHLSHQVLRDFVRLARQKVVPGGAIIFETINPTSMTALSSNYFRDPTHVFPQHPDTLGFLMTSLGLDVVETKFLAPVPESSKLRELKNEVYMTPRWSEMLELFNHNIRILNSVIFGYQDYCVVGRVRG